MKVTGSDIDDQPQDVVKEPPLWATVHILCDLLKSHICRARADLVSSSVSHPIYGVLQSIRAVLEEALIL